MLIRGSSVLNRLLLIGWLLGWLLLVGWLLDWLLLIDWLLNLLLFVDWLLCVKSVVLLKLHGLSLLVDASASSGHGAWHAVSSGLAVSVEVDAGDSKSGDEEHAVKVCQYPSLQMLKMETYNSSPPSPDAAAIAFLYVTTLVVA